MLTVSKKQVYSGYRNVIKIHPLADVSSLLSYIWPLAMVQVDKFGLCKLYAGNMDTCIIVTAGGRPFGNISPAPELIEKYNMQAGLLKHALGFQSDYNELLGKSEDMLLEFVQEVLTHDSDS